MGVGVDREEAAEVTGELDELVRGVAPLGAAVDLDGDAVLRARLEDGAGIELALRPRPSPCLLYTSDAADE